MKLTCIKKNGIFTPAYDSDYEKAKKLKDGEYEFSIKLARSLPFHKKFFSLIRMVFDNQDVFFDEDKMRKWLTMEAGFIEETKTPNGIMIEAKSIAFDKMDELEFGELFSKVLSVVLRFLKCDEKMVNENLINYM